MPLSILLFSGMEIFMQMVFTKNEHTEASQRYLSIVNFICSPISVSNSKTFKILPFLLLGEQYTELMTQMEFHPIIALSECAVTLMQE